MSSPTNTPANLSIHSFQRGLPLLFSPQLRQFVLIPLAVNIALFVFLTSALMNQFSGAMDWLEQYIPDWLSWLSWVIWAIFSLTILVVYGFAFSLITTLIAAPFYGLLAEKTELLVTGKGPPPESLARMIPRTLGRELVKLGYLIPRSLGVAIALLILGFIPVIGFIAPALGFLWTAWNMAIQYIDYSADNHQTPFKELRATLGQHRGNSLIFGSVVTTGMMIPLVNIILPPLAVVSGTLYWLETRQS